MHHMNIWDFKMKFSIDDILKKKEEDLTHTTSGLFLFFLFGNRRSFNNVNSIKSLNQATFYSFLVSCEIFFLLC